MPMYVVVSLSKCVGFVLACLLQSFFEPCKYIICGENNNNPRTQRCMITRWHVLGKGKTGEIKTQYIMNTKL